MADPTEFTRRVTLQAELVRIGGYGMHAVVVHRIFLDGDLQREEEHTIYQGDNLNVTYNLHLKDIPPESVDLHLIR